MKQILHRRAAPRLGYTLIELLVVIAIIGVLTSLLASGVFAVLAGTKKGVSKTRVRKLHSALLRQWSAANDTAEAQRPPNGMGTLALSGEALNRRRLRERVIWTKVQMIRQFPETYEEAVNPGQALQPTYLQYSDLPAHYYYRQKVNEALTRIQQGNLPRNRAAENSACLLLALSINRRGNVNWDANEAFGVDAIKDTNNDGLPEVVDGWGNPIVFYRWGCFNAELDATCASLATTPPRLHCDSADPEQILMSGAWNNTGSQGANDFNARVHPIRERNANGLRAFFSEPTVVSYGPDGRSGLGPFMAEDNTADAADNLYSFRLR